ncbi:MAG: TonB-dependent receptor plug domain-containing protein, partial [Gammaproteobacteria bacterium]|nr:TonB-dependent receptor plug domain-containing protein [Gammaproteobacteria bacterium]
MYLSSKKFLPLVALILFQAQGILAQEDSSQEVEEITVTGSQIKGAKISGALPVSVISIADIEGLGVDSGEELLENIAENGMNLFNESENASGGVNSARGDMGAYNLRNMGTGNTLTLLNGRRLVNSPGYQTELIGGDYVPAMTVNSNLVPVWGIERMEILRDGASAIYGADAVAGVVNNVLQKDYE